ncbi:MAG: hypothetical protein LBQ36_06420 [Synergistaceae bacterium]|jgi:hypothetical protein|nr:hypothetical protein [Synergistaceae bacterium]
MKGQIFSRSAVALLLSGAIFLFALSVLLSAKTHAPVSGLGAGPGAYSKSAVGCAGFYSLLRRSGIPASASSRNSLSDAGAGGTIIIAEPNLAYARKVEDLLEDAPRALVVLPKWRWVRDGKRPSWISEAELLGTYEPIATLSLISNRGGVFRKEWPLDWPANELGINPSGSGVAQLIAPEGMKTIVGDGEGALVAEITRSGKKIWILSDPDVMSNHGIMRENNADFMLRVVSALRSWESGGGSSPVVFDETLHGFMAPADSPVKLLFMFPFWAVTLLTCCSASILAMAGAGRFGAPIARKPELDFGKSSLIANSAALLDYGGHHAQVMDRYVSMTIRSVGRALHAPPGQDEAALAAWLDRIGNERGVSVSCAAILRAKNTPEASEKRRLDRLHGAARDIHRWKGEIANGPAIHRGHS